MSTRVHHSLVAAEDARRLMLSDDPAVSSHRISAAPTFHGDGLSRLLTCHPRAAVECYGVTHDAPLSRPIGMRWLQDIAQQAGSLRLTRLLDFHPDLHGAIHGLYDELEVRNPGIRATDRRAELWVYGRGEQPITLSDPGDRIWWQVDGGSRMGQCGPPQQPLRAGQAIACTRDATVSGISQINVALVTRHRLNEATSAVTAMRSATCAAHQRLYAVCTRVVRRCIDTWADWSERLLYSESDKNRIN